MKRAALALAVAGLALGGCGILGSREKPKTPTVGERIPVLTSETGVEVDPALADIEVSLPGPATNDSWTQPGGNAAKSMGHVGLPRSLSRAWNVSIGSGSSIRMRLAAGPVVGDGRIYTIDSRAVVRAFDARTGSELWRREVGSEEARRGGTNFLSGEYTGNVALLFGGGVSFDGGRVYATSGLGDVSAFNAETGEEVWRVRPGGPLRGAPTIANDNVYVLSSDNQLYALNPADGKTRWNGAGSVELAGVLGVASPAAAQGTVVAGFSSGELTAYRYENGRVVWQDALARTSISTAVASLSDIDAEPVIDAGRVYAIGQGGRMVALELNTGQRLWELNVAGIATPWVAGEWVFVVTDDARLLAIARSTGKVRWISQLRRWRDEEDKKGPIRWIGPMLAGERLVLVSSDGRIANVSPADGSVQSMQETDMTVSVAPIIANDTLYILNDKGDLSAWR